MKPGGGVALWAGQFEAFLPGCFGLVPLSALKMHRSERVKNGTRRGELNGVLRELKRFVKTDAPPGKAVSQRIISAPDQAIWIQLYNFA